MCLAVKDLSASLIFYHKLGYKDHCIHLEDKWAILTYRGGILGLYEGHIKENCFNFRGGNIEHLVKFLEDNNIEVESVPLLNKDGSGTAFLRDPDNNLIFFDTAKEELEETKAS